MKRLSIGLRLTLWYLMIFAAAQLVFGTGMWFILRNRVYDLVDDNLETRVEDLKNFLLAQPKDVSLAKLQEEVKESYSLEHSGDYLQLYMGNGVWIYRSPFLQAHALPTFDPGSISRASFENRKLGGKHFRFITQKLEVNGRAYSLQTGLPTNDVRETLNLFRRYLEMFAPLLLLVAAIGGYWLSRRALAPVDAIVQTARDISGTNLNRRLNQLKTGDELQRLSDTLNEMLERIERAFLRVTQFTADASHELRTPISLVRTEAELALRKPRGEAEYRESLRHILLEAERTTALIEELLSLARADSGSETLHMHPIDLRETLRGIAEDWRQVAAVRNLQFEARLEASDSFVLGDETSLRRVVNILLDNAFKYTPPPGTVLVMLQRKNDRVVITVRDSGVGIAAAEQSKIFERFYRVDKARSREMGGAGLGLSIAEWIVGQHRGSIEVQSNPGQGSVFRVELPAAAVAMQSPMPA
jgi:heavy metal sensor kinase